MTRVERDGASLYYEVAGDGELVAFLGDAGYGAWQWGWQHRAVVGPFAGLVTDLRGTGRPTPRTAPSRSPSSRTTSGRSSGTGGRIGSTSWAPASAG